MKFIIQQDKTELDIDTHIFLDILDKTKYLNSYERIGIQSINKIQDGNKKIPVGTIEFVEKYIKEHLKSSFEHENPIEIPVYLRTDEFLKREYKIVSREDIPRNGRYFIKNASKLKDFNYTGEMEYFIQDEMFEEPKNYLDSTLRLSATDKFVISEEIDIASEYRVYVINNKIEAIANYNGNPLVLPKTELITKAISLIQFNEEFLKSYTIDIMIDNRGNTSIIEIHNFTSVGLYTVMFSDRLAYAYKDGLEYLIKDNKKLIV